MATVVSTEFERSVRADLHAIMRHLKIEFHISHVTSDQVRQELRNLQSRRRLVNENDPCEYDLGLVRLRASHYPTPFHWLPHASEQSQSDTYTAYTQQWLNTSGIDLVAASVHKDEHFLSVSGDDNPLYYNYSGTTDVILYKADESIANDRIRVVFQVKKSVDSQLAQSLRQAVIELLCASVKNATQPVFAVLTDFTTFHFLWLDAQVEGLCRVHVAGAGQAAAFMKFLLDDIEVTMDMVDPARFPLPAYTGNNVPATSLAKLNAINIQHRVNEYVQR